MEELLSELKDYLNIESDFNDYDSMLLSLLYTSKKVIQNFCRGGADEILSSKNWYSNTDYFPLKTAIIQYAAHLFLHRNIITFQQSYELPLAFRFILTPYLKV